MGKDQDAPTSFPGKGLAADVLRNPSKGSCLPPRQELSHGEFETEKVLLVIMRPDPEKGARGPGRDTLERLQPPLTHSLAQNQG